MWLALCASQPTSRKDRSLAIAEDDFLSSSLCRRVWVWYGFELQHRPRAAEVMVDGDRFQVVRARESVQELFATESILLEAES